MCAIITFVNKENGVKTAVEGTGRYAEEKGINFSENGMKLFKKSTKVE